jgi:hypothetical protein
MCFAPQADLVGGAAIVIVGIDALRHVRQPKLYAVGLLPIVLGAHQLIETLVWWGLQGHIDHRIGVAATWVYLAIAFCLLPGFVPWAVLIAEPDQRRRTEMKVLVGIGVGISIVLAGAMRIGPVTAELAGYHIAYGTGLRSGLVIVSLYVLATCGSLLFSSVRAIKWFGRVNLPVVILLAIFQKRGLASLWCAWAAVTSVSVALLLRRESRVAHPGSPIVMHHSSNLL